MNSSNEELERLLSGDLTIVNRTDEQDMDEWYSYFLDKDDVGLVYIARMVIATLAFRHSGFQTSPVDGATKEGMVHSMHRVLDLMKESLNNGSY